MTRRNSPAGPRVREPVQDFALLMETRLRRHDLDRGKRGWLGTDTSWLMSRVFQELGELQHELSKKGTHEGSLSDIRAECADAANFLMMVADQHRPLRTRRRRSR